MKKKICFLLFICTLSIKAQVGIGTITPSHASMLEVSGNTEGGAPYKGFMPPRVPTAAERDLISASSTDAGLLVFVQDTGTLEIWNGIAWEPIFDTAVTITTLYRQDFDSNQTWSYTNNPVFYNFPADNDIWDIVNDLGGGTSEIDNVNGLFLGIRDLNNPQTGGPGVAHTISFNNVDVSSLTNPRIAFDYDIFQFDNNDDVTYEVFLDNVGQGSVVLIDGSGDLSIEGTQTIAIPNGTNMVRLNLTIIQSGDADFAGFDNFRVYGQ